MSAASTPMRPVDTAWLRMDTDVNLMMIVGVWLLAPAIRYEDLRERVEARLLRFERFRQKAVRGVVGAQWVLDEDFDVARHIVVETLSRRRGQSARRALQVRMGELAATPLDPAHPLWQYHLIEHYDGGSALICRIHHCIGDGVALNSVMTSITDGGVEPPRLADHDGDGHAGDWLSDTLLRPLGAAAVRALDLYEEGLAKALDAAEHPQRAALNAARSGVQLASDVAAFAFMPDDAKTPLKGHGTGRKVVSWCEPLGLERVKATGRALGASVNDVLLACVAGAIGHYLRETGEDPAGKDIRAMVPVNLRPLETAWQLGNRFGLVPLLVPVGIDNPIERLVVVRQRMKALKGSYQPLLAYELLALSGLLVRSGQKAISDLFLDKTTAVMTNVAGPAQPLSFCGSRVRQSIFWVPSSGDVGVGVSIISYAGGVQFGLITDEKLCARPDRISDRFEPEFEVLERMAKRLP
ncbi:MAG TPA: wax ester/triacylglycerol synthase family O-acyltransferase, partial [Caldimonas sp.]|nr:wax ester/triacylglycerol synthase family O-acyltransferase [Caldimonas sp.]